MTLRLAKALFLTSLGVALACSSTTRSGNECESGDLRRCICPDDTVSNMVCGDDGTYGECMCGEGNGGAATGGGGGEDSGTGGAAPPIGGAGQGGDRPEGGAATGGIAAAGGEGAGGAPAGGQTTGGAGGVSDGGEAGSVTLTGGTATTGGTTTAGGAPSTGGVPGTGGDATGGVSTGGATGGGTGFCDTEPTRREEVAIIGDSLVDASTIPERIAANATAAGLLPAGELYPEYAMSGAGLADGRILSQYNTAQDNNNTRFVLMTGGGADCSMANSDGALAGAQELFDTMGRDGVEAVLFFFYADPTGPGAASLKACLDELRPRMQTLCEGLTAPSCHWLDLRPVWDGHPSYTSDGILPTAEGSAATGDAIWAAMVRNCIAQ